MGVLPVGSAQVTLPNAERAGQVILASSSGRDRLLVSLARWLCRTLLIATALFFAACTSTPVTPAPESMGTTPLPASLGPSPQATASIVPSPSPTTTVVCFVTEPDLCQQAVVVAEERVPADQQPPLAVTLRTTQTFSICPPSVSFDPAHPETCAVIAQVTTRSGRVDMLLRLSPTGWVFAFFIK